MKYQNILNDKVTQCTICPRNCKLKEGQEGFCKVRKNINGDIILETYGYNTGMAIDPVEKKPLYHFYPNSNVLSFGTNGCNMGCQFCQNAHITKVPINYNNLYKVSPEEIIEYAIKYNCKSIAFTYNDPIVFFEYAIDTAKLARKYGIKTIAVTSGFINIEPAKEFFNYMDAANIDLKGFTNHFYKKNCLAKIEPILDVIKYVKNNTNCWLELTTLLIEGENSSNEEIENECNWILENLGDNVPLHFSAFAPRYKMLETPSTKIETLMRAYNIAQNIGLKYVYTGNIRDLNSSSTYCSNCQWPIIKRDGFQIIENNLIGNKCKHCNTICDGWFE